MNDRLAERLAGGGVPPFTRMNLNNLEATRKTLTKLVRMYGRGEMDAEKARTMGYLFGVVLAYFKTEKEAEIERRIEAVELMLSKTPPPGPGPRRAE